jgi:RNA polymerase sigma-70 factor (ECF subfamily)
LIDRVFREEAGRLTASLVRLIGDFDLAEDMVSEAVAEALVRWPRDGVPDRPGAWLLVTARHRALDRIRREERYQSKLETVAALSQEVTREPDDRMRLIFTCCHPALDTEVQVALTLKAVGGLTIAEIARAFMVSPPTLAKRITRAKQKIVSAAIPYRMPGPAEMRTRLHRVLTVIYLIYNEGFITTAGERGTRRELVDDAEWLAGLVAAALPDEPEPLALLGLIRLSLARWDARINAAGDLIVLADQDRSRWDQRRIDSAVRLIERAAGMGRPGPFQLEAAIAAVHCESPAWEKTDWEQILKLYDLLAAIDSSPVVRLNRAVALSHLAGPTEALAVIDALSDELGAYHLFHATRAALLRSLGRPGEAEAADSAALSLTTNPTEISLLRARLA